MFVTPVVVTPAVSMKSPWYVDHLTVFTAPVRQSDMAFWSIKKPEQKQPCPETQDQTISSKQKTSVASLSGGCGQSSAAGSEVCLVDVPGQGQEEEEEGEGNPSWRRLLLDYTQNTSLHGVRFITEESRFMLRKALWLVVVFSAASFFIFYTYNRISFYLEFNKNVNVEVNYLPRLKFPAVTLCNQNPFKITEVAKRGWYPLVRTLLSRNSKPAASRTCMESEFTCANKACVDRAVVCDLFPDCTDGSDETHCDPCPLLYVNGSSRLNELLPHVTGNFFELQTNTHASERPLYMGRNLTGSIYLYYDVTNAQWKLGKMHGGAVYAFAADDAAHPQNITKLWSVARGSHFEETDELLFECTQDYLELLSLKPMVLPEGLSLYQLYKNSSHKEEDFIETCIWKGSLCVPGSISEKLTDMGVCYTFHDSSDMDLEQSGPGYGLILTMNIEFYEYTKGTEDGLGIKLLMHEASDVPLVKERGVSVSPGLYSFISLETTQVKNLEPPWGKCGKKDLVYYEDYSVARCKMECETEWVDMQCGCRDFFMPQRRGEPKVCDVGTYITCGYDSLVEMRAAGNYCYPDCPTPCVQDNYVPTTSFSVVLGPDTGSKVLDEKSLLLRRRLSSAREVTHRVVREKYLQTIRAFHILDHQLVQMHRFLLSTMENLEEEFQKVHSISASVMTDCIWIRDDMWQLKESILKHVVEPMKKYREVFNARVRQPYRVMMNLVNETWRDAEANPKFDYLGQVTADVMSRHTGIKHMLDALIISERRYVLENLVAMSDVEYFRVLKELYMPLVPYIGQVCLDYCLNENGSELTAIIKELTGENLLNLTNFMNEEIEPKLTRVKNKYFHSMPMWILTQRSQDDLTNYMKLWLSLQYSMDEQLEQLDSYIAIYTEFVCLLNQLHGYIWEQQCNSRLVDAFSLYKDGHSQIENLLQEMKLFIHKQQQELNINRTDYINERLTLEKIGLNYQFTEIIDDVQMKKTRLLSAFNDRILLTDKIRDQFSTINYIFVVLVKEDTLAQESKYWKVFEMKSTKPVKKKSTTVDGYQKPVPDVGIQPSASARMYWKQVQSNLASLKGFLQIQVEDLVRQVKASHEYFTTYVKGNQLTQDFYGQNFLQVDLHYKELTERKVSQQKAYEYQNLLSEIGGLMGLLLGASVLSICEILDLFIYNIFRKCCRPQVYPELDQALQ